MRIIVGGPATGKTTLAQTFGGKPLTTDTLPGWSEASQEVANVIASRAAETVEGVATARGLRKYLAQNPHQRMDDVEVIVLDRAHRPLSDGQQRMQKGVGTVWNSIAADVQRRGARVRRG